MTYVLRPSKNCNVTGVTASRCRCDLSELAEREDPGIGLYTGYVPVSDAIRTTILWLKCVLDLQGKSYL